MASEVLLVITGKGLGTNPHLSHPHYEQHDHQDDDGYLFALAGRESRPAVAPHALPSLIGRHANWTVPGASTVRFQARLTVETPETESALV